MSSEKYHALIPEGRCAKCRKIPWRYSEWFKNGPYLEVEHHDSWAALEEAAAAGCDLCRSLRARVIHEIGANIPEDVPCLLRVRFLDSKRGGLYPTYAIGSRKEHEVGLAMARADGFDIPHETLGSIKRLGTETQDSDLNALISERIYPWIEDCLHQRGRHTNCKPVSIRGQHDFHLPTRLIDVGNVNNQSARLIETECLLSIKPKPEYLALSYCWGQSNEPAKTTRANYQARHQQLPVSDFPKTIRDAIDLTRRMGIRYLWVDAICIIQPNNQDQYLIDWGKEASMMAYYYANARCLISALSASDSSQGFFIERHAQRYPQKSSPIALDEASNETHYLPVDELTFHKEFSTQPLLTRGWCFQERILSPRALHWSANCLYWQCQSLTEASEQDPDDELPRVSPVFARDEPQIFQRDTERALTSSWLRAVVEYMRANFTHLTDRLIAIESLGTRLAEIHEVEYFAGVFSSQLTQGLAWKLIDSVTSEKLSYFPSWSWASSTSEAGWPVRFEHEQDSSPKSLIRIDGRGEVFPPDGSAVDFDTTEKRSLRLEAPLLEITPAGVREEIVRKNLVQSFNYEDDAWGAKVEMIFDAPRLVPEDFGPAKVLMLSVLDYQTEVVVTGLIIRPKDHYYERVGFVSFKTKFELPEADKAGGVDGQT